MTLEVDLQIDGISPFYVTEAQLRAHLKRVAVVERLVLIEQPTRHALVTVYARDLDKILALDGTDFMGQALSVRILARRVVSA